MTTPKSHQETFDHVVRALIKQGRPSVEPRPECLTPDEEWTGGSCMYRGADGCKCAAGHCIPDDKYDPAMEGVICVDTGGFGSSARLVQETLRDAGHDPVFVRELQNAHDMDSTEPPEVWLNSFKYFARGVAERFNLSTAVLDEVRDEMPETAEAR